MCVFLLDSSLLDLRELEAVRGDPVGDEHAVGTSKALVLVTETASSGHFVSTVAHEHDHNKGRPHESVVGWLRVVL